MRNLKRFIVTALLAVLSAAVSMAQTKVVVSGVVTSAEDNLPMMGAGVMAGPGVGVITNLDGEYTIDVAPGTTLTFSSIGYEECTVIVPNVAAFTHNVVMQPESMKLDDVVVIA